MYPLLSLTELAYIQSEKVYTLYSGSNMQSVSYYIKKLTVWVQRKFERRVTRNISWRSRTRMLWCSQLVNSFIDAKAKLFCILCLIV